MDVTLLLAAFALGFAASAVGLPPLVGYLAAGFILHEFAYETTDNIQFVADIGVLLLLFSIGLKLKIRTLARPEVYGGASIAMVMTTALITGVLLVGAAAGLPLLSELGLTEAALLGFAFSFSSTVYAVKALEDRNESSSLAGQIAIGILIVQDLFAVAFLVFSTGELPSLWAIPVVVGVVLLRPVWGWLLSQSGHGELLVLLGFVLAVGVGAASFELVGIKADLGALVIGLSLASHPRAVELADRLLGYKDLLLIGFFLSIGLGGIPSPAALVVAIVALLFLPIKGLGFMTLIPRFGLRARTAWHSAITLTTFSEFGLIVVVAAINEGLLDDEWAAVIAIAVAASFAAAAPTNARRYRLYRKLSGRLEPLERQNIRDEDAVIDSGASSILVFGMGRVGTGAYDELVIREGQVVMGVDRQEPIVEAHQTLGRHVIRGDAMDSEFWERMSLKPDVGLVVLAMSDHEANLRATEWVKGYLPEVKIAAAAQYEDQVAELQEAGVDIARNLFSEAGQGLADDACDLLSR